MNIRRQVSSLSFIVDGVFIDDSKNATAVFTREEPRALIRVFVALSL